MTQQGPDFANVVRAVQLDSIRLVRSSTDCVIDGMPDTQGQMDVSWHTEVKRQDDATAFVVLADIQVMVRTRDDPAEDLIAIGARYELAYSLQADSAPSDEELKAFAAANGIFNAWPYWREFVQSTASRMGLPPVVLPLLKVGTPPVSQNRATNPS
ncbi:MAG: hypothetical protein DHS20C21_00580 [Gemmatimonadota bacterium]|nr:MAG: hypothetical protein DHS20C21_00580 [Gemmatimonadota bacterium]